MMNRGFIDENEVARLELSELIAHLDERSFNCPLGLGWTVSTLLCHLAFWDQRVLFLLREWQSGHFETSRLSSQSVDSINHAVKVLSQSVTGPAAAKLALDSAAAVDSQLKGISDELIGQIVSAGFERVLRRSLHRLEHLQKIRRLTSGF
jgi:hypothetical protein